MKYLVPELLPPKLLMFAFSLPLALSSTQLTAPTTAEPTNAGAPQLVLQVLDSGVTKIVRFSPDSTLLASAGQNNLVKLWDLRTGRTIRMFTARGILCTVALAFSPDGTIVATAGLEHDVEIWDARTGELRRLIPMVYGEGLSLAFSPDGQTLATGGGSLWGVTALWEVRSGALKSRLVSPTEASDSMRSGYKVVYSVAFSPNGKTLATGSLDGEVRLWDLDTGKPKHVSRQHQKTVWSLAFSRDGRVLGSASEDKTLGIWDAQSGELNHMVNSDGILYSVAFSSDDRILAYGGETGSIHLWDVTLGERMPDVTAHSGIVWSIAFSGDGSLIACGGSDRTIKLWDAKTYRFQRTLANYTGSVIRSIAITRDDKEMVFGDRDGIRLWNLQTDKLKPRLAEPASGALSIAFAPDGTRAVGRNNGEIEIRQPRTGEVKMLHGHSDAVNCVSFSPDGKILASGSDDKTVRLWYLETGQAQALGGDAGRVFSVAFSPDGKILAGGRELTSGREGVEIVLWDARSGGTPRQINDRSGRVASVAFSPDSTLLATGNVIEMVKLWNSQTGALVRAFAAPPKVFSHDSEINSVAFSPDGTTIASGSSDKTIKIWDVNTGTLNHTLIGHSNAVEAVVFFPHRPFLASGGYDSTVRIWDIRAGNALATLLPFGQNEWVLITRDGRFDTSNLDDIPGVTWVFPDDPFRSLPAEAFMRDYYEPQLLSRLLAGESLPSVRLLADLNRVQPQVKITSVRPGTAPDLAVVTVEVSKEEGQFERSGKNVTMKSSVYDLRLFRAGQLVGQEPEPKAEVEESLKNGVELTPEQLQAWREARRVKPLESRVQLDAKTDKLARAFTVRLPHGQAGKQIEFTAYAFNEDRVKSETARATYTVPQDAGPVRKRAYVISMGVNAYQRQGWDLHFAASDAKRIQVALARRLAGYEVVPVSLISDCRREGCPEDGDRRVGQNHATKVALHAVLEKLAGHELSEGLKKSLPPGAKEIEKAGPDDLMVMFVSSHGYTSKEGTFYIVPSDSGDTEGHAVKSELLQRWISSDELSGWLRDVDAGDMVMIVDTCHSASTVGEPGFKPGPMGSRGLGQLAYDKGMSILAASQADDVALESEKLKQGLLTYALVQNGLGDRQAATDGKISMDGWLQYGADRVPTLYEEVLAGKIQKFTATSKDTDIDIELSGGSSSLKKPNAFQQPSFFNFQKKATGILLAK